MNPIQVTILQQWTPTSNQLIDSRLTHYEGGFIWDYIDQALYVTDKVTGQQVLRYGGDFNDRHSDYEFSGDGIVFATVKRSQPCRRWTRVLSCVNAAEWLYRVPKLTFWRRTTDMIVVVIFQLNQQLGLAADMFITLKDINVKIDDKSLGLPTAPDNNPTTPQTTVDVTYLVSQNGNITITVNYTGTTGLPELPALRLSFIMPEVADGFQYTGLSGETYPDRQAGALTGTFDIVGLPLTPYLVPQEMGMHMATHFSNSQKCSVTATHGHSTSINRLTFNQTYTTICFFRTTLYCN
ncbi:hypothetical protein Pfo_031552 [Paulownia fortunei]|nr:hypothetical protein Pfo_031552 [Paulownia fortunei]